MGKISKQKNKIITKNGFTVLELIISLFVLTVGVGGAMNLVQQTISASSSLDARLTASYLAQEGLEIVKNLRDRAWLEGAGEWGEYVQEGEWEADYQDTTLSVYQGRNLNIDTDGFYSYSPSDTETRFTRRISIIDEEQNVKKVTVEVVWQEKGEDYSFQVSEYITDWLASGGG